MFKTRSQPDSTKIFIVGKLCIHNKDGVTMYIGNYSIVKWRMPSLPSN